MPGPKATPATEEDRAQAARPRAGELLELSVEGLAYGGAGVARRDGYVVFVEGAFPGDRVSAQIVKARRAYANARVERVLEPSADRVAPRCDHEGEPCPGSPWQELRYERQLESKQEQVADALVRLGGLEGFEQEPILPAEEIWRYRNKLEYSFGQREDANGDRRNGAGGDGDPDGGGRMGSSLVLGFHARGRWNRIEDAHDCMLASERNNAVRNLVRDWCASEGLSAYDRRRGDGLLRNLVVRESRRGSGLQVRLVTSEGELRAHDLAQVLRARFPDAGLLLTRTDNVAETSAGGRTTVLAGPAHLEEQVCGLRFRISPEAFFQANTEMAERLYELAASYAGLSGLESVFDLYCGTGTLGLVLSLRAAGVWGVDVSEAAIADAMENARLNEVDNARFFAGDARHAIRELCERAPRPDVVVIDPPRAGLSKKVVRRVLETRPKRIVYVSCNPTTLAPNARQMADAGFRLVRVRPVDMFPHTPHIECVALLERTNG